MTTEARGLSWGRAVLLGCTLAVAGLALLAGSKGAALADPNKAKAAAQILWAVVALLAVWAIAFRWVDRAFDSLVAFARRQGAQQFVRRADAGKGERIGTAAFFGAAGLCSLIPLFDPALTAKLADENNLVEALTSLFYLIATGACLFSLFRAKGRTWLRFNLAGLALMFFFVGMEEISWGQQYLEFATPQALEGINIQGEMTLHNIWSISLFQYPALLVTTMLLCVLPLAHVRSARWRDLMNATQFPVAPVSAAKAYGVAILSYFVIGFAMGSPTPLPFSWGDFIPSVDDEYLEFYLSFLFMIYACAGWRIRLGEN